MTAPDSVPQLPAISQDDDLQAQAVANSLAVKSAEQKVAAAQARATGEHKAAVMPTLDLAAQYAYLAKFNNYDLYYRNYQANNFSGGINLRIPIFNSVQKAKAQEADADAIIANKQADLTKNQVSEDALSCNVRCVSSQQHATWPSWSGRFRREIWMPSGRMKTGTANTRDQQNAELETDDKYAAYLDAEFELAGPNCNFCGLPVNWKIGPFPPRKSPFAVYPEFSNFVIHKGVPDSSNPETIEYNDEAMPLKRYF